jgi:hypothetical protein
MNVATETSPMHLFAVTDDQRLALISILDYWFMDLDHTAWAEDEDPSISDGFHFAAGLRNALDKAGNK